MRATAPMIRNYLGDDYKESDEQLISLYVETYAHYQRMRKELKSMDLMMEYTNKAGATNYIKNPLTVEITKTVQTLNNLLKSLGLTPAQRKNLQQKSGGGEDDFDDF